MKIVDWKTKLVNSMRSATSNKEGMNRQILKWHKSFKEVVQKERAEMLRGKVIAVYYLGKAAL